MRFLGCEELLRRDKTHWGLTRVAAGGQNGRTVVMTPAARPLAGQTAPQGGLDCRDLDAVSASVTACLRQMIHTGPAVGLQIPNGAAPDLIPAQEVGAFECLQDDPIGLLQLRGC